MITKGRKVKFHYKLKVNDKIVEDSHSGSPLEYVHGKDNIISGLEKGLEGHKEGDAYTIEVHPEEGYGTKNPEAIVEIEKEKVPEGDLKLGSKLIARGESGQSHEGIVQDIRSETVLVDFNHPLAGKTLTFDVEVLKVSLDI